MPELPEVETIRRDLERTLKGRSLSGLDVLDTRLMPTAEIERWNKHAIGCTWDIFQRRGKYLVVQLSNGYRVVFHLRMTGQLVVNTERPPKYRMRLQFDRDHDLTFIDQRRFGEVWLLGSDQAWPSKTQLGPDALTELDESTFQNLMKGRSTRIQSLLMDQSAISGVGNIYAQEALFKACIRPSRRSGRLTRGEAARLYLSLQQTLLQAIEHRGSTARNYRDAYGRAGSAQFLHSVYRKGGRPCPRCQSVLRSARVGGRGTVFCSKCQK